MIKFNVSYSEEKDIETYLNILWHHTWVDYGSNYIETAYKNYPKEFVDALVSAGTKELAISTIKEYFSSSHSSGFNFGTSLIVKWFDRIINEEQQPIINSLEKTYDKKFPFTDIKIYLSTFFASPYNFEEKYYMVNRGANIFWLLNITRHELNHFMYYYYFDKNLENQGISLENREFLKESLAILTSGSGMENQNKIKVLPIQNFVAQHKDKKVGDIIDLVIKSDLLK